MDCVLECPWLFADKTLSLNPSHFIGRDLKKRNEKDIQYSKEGVADSKKESHLPDIHGGNAHCGCDILHNHPE